MGRRRRNRRKAKQQRQAVINIVLVVAALVISGWLFWSLQPEPYDQDTLCVVAETLPPHTAVIIDKTDEYSAAEAGLIAAAIRRSRDELTVGERFTLFELDERGQFNPRGEMSMCNPGRGNQVNPLFQNPKMIEERYADLFEAPMEAILDDLVTPKEAPASPILEALARLAQTENFSDRAPERSILMVSDMLQNSDVFTAYGGAGEMPEGVPDPRDAAKIIIGRFGDGLRGAELEIRLIPRERHLDLQRGPLTAYWNAIFAELGIDVRWRDL